MISQSSPDEAPPLPQPRMPEEMIAELNEVFWRYGWTLVKRSDGWYPAPYTRH